MNKELLLNHYEVTHDLFAPKYNGYVILGLCVLDISLPLVTVTTVSLENSLFLVSMVQDWPEF